MLLTNLDLPPPTELLRVRGWIPSSRLWLSTVKDSKEFILCYPFDRVADWQAWRSTVYRIRYYNTYTLRYFEVKPNDYTLFVQRKKAIHMEWLDSQWEQLI